MDLVKTLALITFVFSSGCSDWKEKLGVDHGYTEQSVPNDESTQEERDRINSTLEKIENLAQKFGYSGKFRRLPISVITEDSNITHRIGYCAWDESGDGRFIALNRIIFQQDQPITRFDTVFDVLLHEIGHCYFKRMHDSEIVKKDGYAIEVLLVDSTGGTQMYFDELPISAMYTKSSIEGSPLTKLPVTFEEYFVSEIVRGVKIKSINEMINSIPGLRLVPKN
jgi:hypothetical protein